MIGIVDYGAGNLRSVAMALEALDLEHTFLVSSEEILQSDSLLLPGVGSFKLAMNRLESRGFVEPIRSFARQGKPLVGICLGMQLLFESSSELGLTNGLGILSGEVIESPGAEQRGPALGWEAVEFESPLKGHHGDYYFAHSFEAKIGGDTLALATSNRDAKTLIAGVRRGSIIGFQFHPEKSGDKGIALLGSTFELLGVRSSGAEDKEGTQQT